MRGESQTAERDRPGSKRIVADQLTIGTIAQKLIDAPVDRLLQEPDRAVAEEEIGAEGCLLENPPTKSTGKLPSSAICDHGGELSAR